MIDLSTYSIFESHKKDLKELSKDDSDSNDIQYMTESNYVAIDFDTVKRVYVNDLGLSEDNACSVDAIAKTENSIVFVEFKNGSVNKRNVKDKIRDSLLIFCDITKEDLEYTRENVDLVVVYNEERNPLPNQYTKGITQESSSRRLISKKLIQLGRQEIVLFDLERYKKLYFKSVHTYTKEEFEDYIEKLIS